MGGQNSIMRSTLEAEVGRLLRVQRSPPGSLLTLAHLVQMQLPPSPFNLDPTHLGVLWLLDRNKNGFISTDDFFALAKEGERRMRCYQRYEFQSQMQGFCMLILRDSIAVEGEAKIVEWLKQVVLAAGRTMKFSTAGDQQFIREDVARMLHTIFKINEIQGVEFGDFWAGLREAGHEEGLLDLADQRQKSWVPFIVMERLLGAMVSSIKMVMDEIFPMSEALPCSV